MTGEVSIIEYGTDSISKIPLPQVMNGKVKACTNPHGFRFALNPVRIWLHGKGEIENCSVALDICTYRRSYEAGLTYNKETRNKWYFGGKFLETNGELGFLHEESKIKMLLKSCCDTILRQNMSKTHALRTGPGGNDPQVKRGNDLAMRRDIDYEYHLHYWETENGIEFASVVVHNDMTIPA